MQDMTLLPGYSKFSERDRRLAERAVNTLFGNLIEPPKNNSPFVFKNRRAIVPSPRTYQGVWNWDGAFHTIGMSYFDKEIAHDQVRILLDFQAENGQLPDVVYTTGKTVFRFTKPPVLAWAVMCSDRIAQDTAFLNECYDGLLKNLHWWETQRFDGKLFGYKVDKMESGWDNTVRFDFPYRIADCYAVDCCGFMVDFYKAMAYIAERTGRDKEIAGFEEKRAALEENIRRILYNAEKGFFCDYDFRLHRHTNRVSPASFLPLFCGAASKEQAEAMKTLAESETWFYPGIPTISYNHPRYRANKYWRGPCWLNTAYFTVRGLWNYGYRSLADSLTENLLNWCAQNEESIYEYYDSKTGKGLGARDFGWSSVFILELLLLKYEENRF